MTEFCVIGHASKMPTFPAGEAGDFAEVMIAAALRSERWKYVRVRSAGWLLKSLAEAHGLVEMALTSVSALDLSGLVVLTVFLFV